jgi:hypothetical protein
MILRTCFIDCALVEGFPRSLAGPSAYRGGASCFQAAGKHSLCNEKTGEHLDAAAGSSLGRFVVLRRLLIGIHQFNVGEKSRLHILGSFGPQPAQCGACGHKKMQPSTCNSRVRNRQQETRDLRKILSDWSEIDRQSCVQGTPSLSSLA